MAAFNFPNSPSTNDLHTENGVTYKWNGTVWKRQNASYTDATNLNVTGISTFAGNITANGNIVGDNSTDISGINDVIATALYTSDTIVHRGESGDNTKIRFPADDTITAETNGSERLRIASDGKVGINETTPERQLDVNGDILGTAFMLKSNTSASSGSQAHMFRPADNTLAFATNGANERVRITSDGDVCINRTGPIEAAKLSIQCDATQAAIGIQCNHTNTDTDLITAFNSAGSNIVNITAETDNSPYLKFELWNGSSAQERFRVNHLGNVAIGGGSAASNRLELIDDPQGFPTDSAQPLATVLLKHGTSGSNRRWIGIGASLTSAWIQSSSPGGSGLNAPLCINPGGGGIIQIHGKDLYASANADNLIIGSQTAGHTGITILCDATYDGSIHFGDGDNPNGHTRGYMRYYHSDDSLRFANNGAVEMLTIGSGTGGNYGGGYLWWNGDANTGFNDRKTYGKITLRAGRADSTTVDDDSTAVKIYPAETRSSTLETKWGGIGWQHLDPENWNNYDGQQAWLGMSLNDTSGQERDRLEVHMNSGVSNDSHPNLCNLRIHPFGYVEHPNQPGFLCTGRSGFSGSRDGAFATVYPSNEVYDTLGNHNLSNGTFTAPCAGRFLFYCFGLIYSMPETNFSQMKFIRNGSTYGQLVQFNGTGGNHRNFSMSIVAALSKNDTFAHQYYRTNGQSHDPYPSQWNWGGYMLG